MANDTDVAVKTVADMYHVSIASTVANMLKCIFYVGYLTFLSLLDRQCQVK